VVLAAGTLNDVWSYNISSTNWNWVGGENTRNCGGTLFTPNAPSTTAFPACSIPNAAWFDAQGLNFMSGKSSTGNIGIVFRFVDDSPGIFTLLNGMGDLTPRSNAGSVTSSDGTAWIFGGDGISSFGGILGKIGVATTVVSSSITLLNRTPGRLASVEWNCMAVHLWYSNCKQCGQLPTCTWHQPSF
jgi:hypothetical protein